jgi:RHS repeat-associated protein
VRILADRGVGLNLGDAMPVSGRLHRLLIPVFFALLVSSSTPGQITNVTNDQSTPVPGAGHDYVQMLNETVNPANGSVSLRFNVPVPKGRGLSIPFGFAYDSNGVRHLQSDGAGDGGSGWYSNDTSISQGGWGYSAPLINYGIFSVPWFNGGGGCSFTSDFVFQDPTGGRHALGLSTTADGQGGDGSAACGISPVTSAGDDLFRATTPAPQNTGNPSIWVADLNGTLFHFSNVPNTSTPSSSGFLPDYMEDRNGNKITFSQTRGVFTYTDTLGRAVLSSSGFGVTGNTVSVSGLSGAFTLSWGAATANYPVNSQYLNPPGNCISPPNVSGTQQVVTAIALPGGRGTYQLSYDATHGLLSKVVYPSGGYVRYVWGTNPLSDIAEYAAGCTPGQVCNPPGFCNYRYDTPVVLHRFVSFDGTNEVLQQDFSYSTNWSSPSSVYWNTKQTTVTSTASGVSFQTIYTYAPSGCGGPDAPNVGEHFAIQCAVEQTVVYENTDTSILRTVNKTWQDVNMLLTEQTALENGQTSKTIYSYANNNTTPLLIEKDEYDYGQGSPGPLARKTITTYQPFGNTPIYTFGPSISNQPCKVDVYSVGTSPIAETQYFYDGGTALCGASGTPSVAAVSNLPLGTHDETNYGPSSTAPRGNLTRILKVCKPNCTPSYPTTTYSFDETGQVLTATDACGNAACGDVSGTNHTITYSYVDNYDSPPGANTNAFITQITDPLGHISKSKYAYSDGQLIQSLNPNDINHTGPGTTYSYNDALRRPTETDYPDGGKTTFAYNDTAPSPTVTVSKLVSTSPAPLSVTTITTMDGLGHTVQTALTSDPDGTTYTPIIYDGLGRPYKIFNPTRCGTPTTNCGEATWGYVTNTYDALGRTTRGTKQDGQIVQNSYSGNCTTTTDEALKARKACTDALGRLTQIFEDSTGVNYETDYTYDGLDNLVSVYQRGGTTNSSNWHIRRFTYDSLSRLQSASNPESGTSSYTYDANGNLSFKTSPAPNQTGTATVTLTYCYDALNRLTAKGYTQQTCTNGTVPSPAATYLFDQTSYNGLAISNGIGRRTGMADAAGSEAWSYDSAGRILTDQRTTSGITFAVPYTYNLDGSMASVNYPEKFNNASENIVFQPGGAGRPLSEGATNYWSNDVSNVHYAPNGAICHMNGHWGNTFTHIWTFNNRFQPARIQLFGTNYGNSPSPCVASTDPPNGGFDFGYSFVDANGHNNGNVVQITAAGAQWYRGQTFTYDSLNRISTAASVATPSTDLAHCWGEQYSYDAWANLVSITPTQPTYNGCTQESGFNFSGAIGTSNRITAAGYNYDTAGNIMAAPPTGTTYTYDAENRLVSAGGLSYTYDGDGKRIFKAPSNAPTQPNKIYWYGTDGNVIVETDGAGNTLYRHYYFYGIHVARMEGYGGWVDHYGLDHLGNTRFFYGYNGAWDLSDYYPFGGERIIQSASNNQFKFTGKERDSESGLDNFGARYDSSFLGRFMSPDPDGAGAIGQDPQSWNAYAYVSNNPLNLTDPNGANVLVCQTVDTGGGTGGASPATHCADVNDDDYKQFLRDNPNLQVTPSGAIYAGNVKIGSETYYDKHAFDSLIQAGHIAQIGLNYSLLLTAPNYLAIGGAHALLAGSSLTVLSGQACAIACPAIPILGNKLDFLFGLAQNIGPNAANNIQRSTTMLEDMESVGLKDSPEVRQYVSQKMAEALNDPAALQQIQGNGRKVIDVFLTGPGGNIKLETVWQGSKLITLWTKR